MAFRSNWSASATKRKSPHDGFDGMNCSQYWESNEKGANTLIEPKKNREDSTFSPAQFAARSLRSSPSFSSSSSTPLSLGSTRTTWKCAPSETPWRMQCDGQRNGRRQEKRMLGAKREKTLAAKGTTIRHSLFANGECIIPPWF